MLKVAVMVSGRGSNLEAILQRQREGVLGAEVSLVVSNYPDVKAVQIAKDFGIEVFVCSDRKGNDRKEAQMEISNMLTARDVGLVVLAGYDRILTKEFVRHWQGRIINIHPSLLPAFGGTLHAQAEALKHGVKISGCTVHFVTEDVDAGPIIAQAAVPVFENDTVESLSDRILREEHRILPEAIRLFAQGRLTIQNGKVLIKG